GKNGMRLRWFDGLTVQRFDGSTVDIPFIPSYRRTVVPSHRRTIAPSHRRTFKPSNNRKPVNYYSSYKNLSGSLRNISTGITIIFLCFINIDPRYNRISLDSG